MKYWALRTADRVERTEKLGLVGSANRETEQQVAALSLVRPAVQKGGLRLARSPSCVTLPFP